MGESNLGNRDLELVDLDQLSLHVLVDGDQVGILDVLEVGKGNSVVNSNYFTNNCSNETDNSESAFNATEVKDLDFPLNDMINCKVDIVRDLRSCSKS